MRIFSTFHPIVNTLFVGVLMSRMATSMSIPFLAIYLSMRTDMAPATIGFTIGISALSSTVAGFVGGALSDRLGRKYVMLGALYIAAVVSVGFTLTTSTWLFMLLSFLNGASRAFFEPVSQALMGDLTPQEMRYRVFSIRYIFANFGFAVGPMIGAVLGLVAGSGPFLVTGVFYLLYAVVLHLLVNRFGIDELEVEHTQSVERVTISSALRVITHDRVLLWYLIGGVFMQFGYSQMTTLSEYTTDHFSDGVKLYAWLMTTNAIVCVVFQFFISKWGEKRSPLALVKIGNFMYALGGLGFAFATGWGTMTLAMVVFTIGEVMCFPANSILIDRIAPDGLRGTYYGAQSFRDIGRFLGPTCGLFLLAQIGMVPLFVIIGMIFLGSTVCYGMGERLEHRASPPNPSLSA
ncbi:MDR family MFS transporter [Tumebacillus permanentifrigoris]|uniref:Putative MFS family arabinose efflux permease n=1 Tax=Tumebacillus permanentifrigoris TaxID=378543 RepID=A0A316DCK2_9BACL|nr:MFS transporter [Tumebacillus permanentifrigoris]PWK15941.1 putative MFS family arabinose efflux permease [Tumebacillus permanentifrigoris]